MTKQSMYSGKNSWYDEFGRISMDGVGSMYKIQLCIKRGLDLLVCISAMILLWPIILGISIIVKLDSKGPAFYKHRRIGRDGRAFDLYKFRSMLSGGDDSSYMDYLEALIKSEEQGDGNGLPYRKMSEDGRVTRVGRYLRNYYLDEIPQIINVIKGDMSLVGPRPHVQFEVDYYTEEQKRRLSVKPGVTGLWQVAGKSDCSFHELIQLDLEYIDNWGLMQDFKLIFDTIRLILQGGEKFWARTEKKIPS